MRDALQMLEDELVRAAINTVPAVVAVNLVDAAVRPPAPSHVAAEQAGAA